MIILKKQLILLVLTLEFRSIEFNCAVSVNDLGEEPKLTKGKKTNLCLHVLPFGIKTSFEIEVDEMVALTVRRSFEATKAKDNDVLV